LLTDEFSFLLWQCGSPAYAAIPTTVSTGGAHNATGDAHDSTGVSR
jgi:hypothetical protein